MIEGSECENILWNIERIITMIFIPILNSACMTDKSSTLSYKIKKELLPCLRSFTRYILYQNHGIDIAISSSRADPVLWLGVFKYLLDRGSIRSSPTADTVTCTLEFLSRLTTCEIFIRDWRPFECERWDAGNLGATRHQGEKLTR